MAVRTVLSCDCLPWRKRARTLQRQYQRIELDERRQDLLGVDIGHELQLNLMRFGRASGVHGPVRIVDHDVKLDP
jgi:hypothetical protein